MPSFQRRRGRPVKIWPSKEVQDDRGNRVVTADMDAEPFVTRAAEFPQRSSKAEVPGYQQIVVTRIIVSDDLSKLGWPLSVPGGGLWGRVEWDGETWDIAAPPTYEHGTRHVRHWYLDIRRRPVQSG